jgi:hypothetical protein
MFQPASNTWSPVLVAAGPAPLPRSQHFAFARAGLMYIVGGRSSKSWVNGAEHWAFLVNAIVFVFDNVFVRHAHAGLALFPPDMWHWDPADARWTQLVYAPGTAAIPSAAQSSVVYDAVGDGLYFVPGAYEATFAPNWGVSSAFLYFKFNWYASGDE